MLAVVQVYLDRSAEATTQSRGVSVRVCWVRRVDIDYTFRSDQSAVIVYSLHADVEVAGSTFSASVFIPGPVHHAVAWRYPR